MSLLKNVAACSAVLIISIATFAQQKQLTDDQFFKNNFKGIVNNLPSATIWVDNSSFLLIRDGKTYVVDAKNGTEREQNDTDKTQQKTSLAVSPFTKSKDLYIKINEVETRLTNDTFPEINATLSPDGKYVGYTKNNDLYTVEIATQKENRLTNDGSDVILNGLYRRNFR
jgi:dipeptidyl-peptidase-4